MSLTTDSRLRARCLLLTLALTCTACLVADPADYRHDSRPTTPTSNSSPATPLSHP